MNSNEFTNYLNDNADVYDWAQGEHEGTNGIFVKNKNFDTETHFSKAAIKNNELPALVSYTRQGRNVENITRVTGFFSKVSSWNKGKTGELKDRHRDDDLS